MDLTHFLNQRLAFLDYFYETTSAHFEETKRKIEAAESPYIDERDPEYADEPAFLQEWEDATAAITLLGASCLDILQSTFHVFLARCLENIGLHEYVPRIGEMRQKSWFANYRAFFREHLEIDWADSGAPLELLEQAILARNDFTHNPDFLSLNSFQSVTHSKKYPQSAFADQRWRDLWFSENHTPLIVPREALAEVMNGIRGLCDYLETETYEWERRSRSHSCKRKP